MTFPTRRAFLAYAAAAPSALKALTVDAPSRNATLFIGTYTAKPGGEGSQGIYACGWDADAGSLSEPTLAAATTNPSFLAISPDSLAGVRWLYAVNEIADFAGTHDGSVSPFEIQRGSGKLIAKKPVDAGGAGTCHVAVDHTGRCVFAANYDSGNCTSFRTTENGLSNAVSHFQFAGHGPDSKRQDAPHTHAVTLSPGNGYLLVNDLGLDRIMIYRLDAATAMLAPNAVQPYYSAKPGAGPRHSAFHPNGRWFYSVNELHSTLDHLLWQESSGTLKWLSTTPMLPPNFPADKNTAAELAIAPDGRFLYASNRGHDSIAVFHIHSQSGEIHLLEHTACGGKDPRHFTIDPSGKWLLVANQNGNNVVVFRRDMQSGKLTDSGKSRTVNQPVCLVFS